MYFRSDGLRNMWLDKCLEGPVSEDPSRGNIENEPKHWWNLKASAFTIFNDHFEDNWSR